MDLILISKMAILQISGCAKYPFSQFKWAALSPLVRSSLNTSGNQAFWPDVPERQISYRSARSVTHITVKERK